MASPQKINNSAAAAATPLASGAAAAESATNGSASAREKEMLTEKSTGSGEAAKEQGVGEKSGIGGARGGSLPPLQSAKEPPVAVVQVSTGWTWNSRFTLHQGSQ